MVSLIVPAVVVILLALALRAMDATAAARVPFWTLLPFLPSVAVMIAWLAVVLLGLTKAEGAATVIASISATLAGLAVLTASAQLHEPGPWALLQLPWRLHFLGSAGGVPVVLASLAACSLAFSPGPRRGLAVVGWRRACP